MPALRKPHRIGILEPDLTVDGTDAAHEREAAVLLWVACIEACQRHTGLALYDPESTPLVPVDGHFAPQHASVGATPYDAFWLTTRRDELIWLELALPKAGNVRLHSIASDGKRETFDATGSNVGDQINQVLTAWLSARGLPALPRRFESATAEQVLGVVRVIAPALGEQARAWVAPAWSGGDSEGTSDDIDEPNAISPSETMPAEYDTDPGVDFEPPRRSKRGTDAPRPREEIDQADARRVGRTVAALAKAGIQIDMQAARMVEDTAEHSIVIPLSRAPSAVLSRALANRLPATLKVPALRLLELALGESLKETILAVDAEHPQSLFARFVAKLQRRRDFVLLRRVIAAAPGFARAYGELALDDEEYPGDAEPSELETVAGAGIAALCRPANFDVIERAAAMLREDGRPDEGLRLLERGVRLHDRIAITSAPRAERAHLALLAGHASTKRPGAWLAQAQRSSRLHGCPMDPFLPWYPDQIQIDLWLSDALLAVGRLDEAITLRANRLAGRETTWPRHVKILSTWQSDARLAAWAYAREGYYRGDPARVVEGFAMGDPRDSLDVAMLLDALVLLGREHEVPLAWAHHGLGRGHDGSVARLAAARGLMAAGDWRRGLEELWRVSLGDPCRDDQVAVAHCGLLMSCMPIEVAEAALAERVAAGAHGLARRMARDVADFMPGASKSSIIMRALGTTAAIEPDAASLAAFPAEARTRRAVDSLLADLVGDGDVLVRADRFVDRWIEVVYAGASEDDPARLVHAAVYIAAQTLARYLAATTTAPSPIAGALRTVASEALALVRRHRDWLGDRDVRALLGAIEPLLRKVDRWVGMAWLAAVERACALDERSAGDVAGFARDHATVAARILGPEELAVLATSVARLHRERLDGWESATAAQGIRLALHTGHAGVDELADAVVAQLAKKAIDFDDAIDALHTAAYLAEGRSAHPAMHCARVLLDAGRGPAALALLITGLPAYDADDLDAALAPFADAWQRASISVPLDRTATIKALDDAIAAKDWLRAEKLGRWLVALAPLPDHHRKLALVLTEQSKLVDAMHHFTRATSARSPDLFDAALAERNLSRPTGPLNDARPSVEPAARPSAALISSSPDVPAFLALAASDLPKAAASLRDPNWRARRAALAATAHRSASESDIDVTPRARAAAATMLAATDGLLDRDPILCRILALQLREHAHFPRDPVPRLGALIPRAAFLRDFATRSGQLPEPLSPPVPFVDRTVVEGSTISRISDYVALLKDLAALPPTEALRSFDLDPASYLDVARSWSAAIAADPALGAQIAAGLAKR